MHIIQMKFLVPMGLASNSSGFLFIWSDLSLFRILSFFSYFSALSCSRLL